MAYLRVSTSEQLLGPEAQRAAIAAWALAQSVQVLGWHSDAASGATELDERPGLVAALGQLRAQHAGVLVVARRDRLARDPSVAAAIERATEASGARVLSADGSGNGSGPADAFLRAVVDAAAQYERALIRARITAALAVKRSRGELTGTPPYGWRVGPDGRTLEPHPAEQATAAQVRAWRDEGLSLRAVVARARDAGLVGRTGRPLWLGSVQAMVSPNPDRPYASQS